jgi:hypothetical protein
MDGNEAGDINGRPVRRVRLAPPTKNCNNDIGEIMEIAEANANLSISPTSRRLLKLRWGSSQGDEEEEEGAEEEPPIPISPTAHLPPQER